MIPEHLRAKLENDCPIKLICFDLDDTIIYGDNDPEVGDDALKFSPVGDFDPDIGPEKVVDGPGRVQKLVEGAREVLSELSRIATLTWVSMGPQWQMKAFMDAFGLSKYFDWEIGAYDRMDKGEKVELCINHYNERLVKFFRFNDPKLSQYRITNENVLFVDDNLGYLGRVDTYMHGVKVLWAHYRGDGGMKDLYRDLQEQYEIDLKKYIEE